MRSRTKRGIVRIGITGLLLVGILGLLAGVSSTGVPGVIETEQVVVVTHENGSELLEIPVDDGSEIIVEYEHSVERTLVSDVYVVDGETLVMDRMVFSSFGAGLPSHAEVTQREGRYVYETEGLDYRILRITTGYIADHDLIVDGEKYDLAEIANGGTVEIRVTEQIRPFQTN